ncbi:MAG: tol-pal system protein YbgF [Nitrospinota bacterium]
MLFTLLVGLAIFSIVGCATDNNSKKLTTDMDLLNKRIVMLEQDLSNQEMIVAHNRQDIDRLKSANRSSLNKVNGNSTNLDNQPKVTNPDSIYERSLELFHDKRYLESNKGFRTFIDTFPQDSRGSLAQFWIGESYYLSRLYKIAYVEYQKLLNRWPDSPKNRAALLGSGKSLLKLEKLSAAKKIFQQLIDEYPDDAEAERAKRYLETIEIQLGTIDKE